MLLKDLQDLSIKGLTEMFDVKAQLFCHRVTKNNTGMAREGLSLRYTIITLLGLHRFEALGNQSPVNIHNCFQTLLNNAKEIDNIGDLGLLIWLCALVDPEDIKQIWSGININNVLSRYRDARMGKTTELAWFLTGLSYTALSSVNNPEGLKELSFETYQTVKSNYGGKGIFGHQNETTLSGFIKGRIGSFADQVYPIYAFSRFSQAYNNNEASRIAQDCAEKICSHQGPFGQWWWHYDSMTGRVTGRYPVYSVHQDGMAPMALFAVGEISGNDYRKQIYKGLEWITGQNELGTSMVDNTRNVIWRSFHRKRFKRYADELLSFARLSDNKKQYKDLIVLYESRPYHPGWLLYAFSDPINTDKGTL